MNEDEFSIGQVAERAGLATSALRFYEDQGLIVSTRTDGGQRRYNRDVVRRVSFIRAAQAVGISLGEIGEVLEGLPAGRTPTHADWSQVAGEWQPRLQARIDGLVALRDKLDGCIGCGCLSLENCSLYNPRDVASSFGSGPSYLFGATPPSASSD